MARVDEQKIDPQTGLVWDVHKLLARVVEMQEQLLQVQEKNLLLSAQIRELDRIARDSDDLKGELAAQGVLLNDKSRENKHLHQEMSRIAATLDVKLNEVEELRAQMVEIQQQLKMRESERDLLAVMLNEAENAQRRAAQEAAEFVVPDDKTTKTGNWPFIKGPKKL